MEGCRGVYPSLPRIPPPYIVFWGSKRGDNPQCEVWPKKFWKKFLENYVLCIFSTFFEKVINCSIDALFFMVFAKYEITYTFPLLDSILSSVIYKKKGGMLKENFFISLTYDKI